MTQWEKNIGPPLHLADIYTIKSVDVVHYLQ